MHKLQLIKTITEIQKSYKLMENEIEKFHLEILKSCSGISVPNLKENLLRQEKENLLRSVRRI